MNEPGPEALINELMHNATASGNKPLEQRLADTTVWFYKNKDRIPRDNLAGRQAFLEKAVWLMIGLNAMALERIHELEGMRAGASLWMPRGVAVNGDVRKFG